MTREELEQKVLEEERDKLIKAQVDNDAEIEQLQIQINERRELSPKLSARISYLNDRINRKGKHQCSKRLYGTWDIHGHLCEKTAKVCRNGVWYCGIHDPERRKR